MSITLSAAARNAKVNAVTALVNGGRIRFLTAGDSVVAEIQLDTPAFTTASGGVAEIRGAPLSDEFTGAGTVAKFSIESSAPAVVVSGTVTGLGGGGDIELSDTVFESGDRLVLAALTYTQPPT